MQQPALLRLPARQQLPLQGSRGLGGEPDQLLNTRGRLIETSGKQQRCGDQTHQLRRSEGQLFALALMQIEQQTHILSAEQVLKAEVLQQTDRDLELFGQQRLLERALPVLLGGEPLTGTPMPGTPRRTLLVTHGPGEWHEHSQPVGRILPGFDKTPHVLQGVQPLRALTGAKQMLAQTGIESRQVRQYLPGFQQFRRQGVE